MSQTDRAAAFDAMHHRVGQPLLLTNVWDAGSALAVADAGAEAIATSSWAIAATSGHGDGEKLPFASLAEVVGRIVRVVTVPVTIDFERGYAEDAAAAADNLERLLELGIIGVNVEDGLGDGEPCRDIRDQARRIEVLRVRADRLGIPLFLNARTDLFLNAAAADHAALVPQSKERARAYAAAGASGLFVPGLLQPDRIADICAATDLPVNIMVTDLGVPLGPFVASGARRISRGPAPYLAAMEYLGRLASDGVDALR